MSATPTDKPRYFRRKPTEVEAFIWTGGPDQLDEPPWLVAAIRSGQVRFLNVGSPAVRIVVDENVNSIVATCAGSPGDTVVRAPSGRIYLVEAAQFDDLYEAVDDEFIDEKALDSLLEPANGQP